MNEVANINQNVISREQVVKYLKNATVGSNLNDAERENFLEICVMQNLNPFKREIYPIKYGQNAEFQIVVGYETYIKRAELSGRLNGWNVKVEGNGKDMTATITIHRKDFEKPFIWTVYYEECVGKKKDGSVTKFWASMPRTMLKKVAISQGFRLCFNEVLGGMPYTSDEVNISTEDISYTEVVVEEQEERKTLEQVIEDIKACTVLKHLGNIHTKYTEYHSEESFMTALKEQKEAIKELV